MNFNLRQWFAAQSPRGQLYSGCLVILVLTSCLLYSLGAASLIIRPYLFPSPVAVTTVIPIVRPPTLAPTPTPLPPSTLALPGSTLVATPTQAPIPTRAPTDTPTPAEIPSVTPMGTPGNTITPP